MGRTVHVRLYATARTAAGTPNVTVEIDPAGVSARALLLDLGRRYPKLRRILEVSRILRNDRYLDDLNSTIVPGDAVSVHPPYGGG